MREERADEGPPQGIRPVAGEDQVARAVRKPMAEGVASGLKTESGSMQESSSAEFEVEVVDGDETAWGEERVKEGVVVVAAVGEGNLIDRKDIRHATDKKVVGVRGGGVPSAEFPKGVGEETDYMKVG